MSEQDCSRVNPDWHVGHTRDIVIVGGRPHAYCSECLVICSIADTYENSVEFHLAQEGVKGKKERK